MAVKFTNNASTTITAGINNSVTTVTLASKTGFPSVAGTDFFYATLQSATNSTTTEVVKVTANPSANNFTIERNASPSAFLANDIFAVRVTAEGLQDPSLLQTGITTDALTVSGNITVTGNVDGVDVGDAVTKSGTQTISGAKTFSGNNTISGDTTHSGDLTVSGATALGATTTGSISTTGTITASGEIEGGSLDINGAASIAGAITDVTTLTASGEIEGGSLDINGAVDVNTSNGNVDFDMGSGTFTITSTNTGDQLLLTNTNTGSGLDGAPDIVLRNLYTNVSEIVDNNILGSLHFGGNTLNVAGNAISGTTENFGRILCLSNDVTDGTHDGILDFRVADNGTVATRMQVKPDGIDVTGTVTADGLNVVTPDGTGATINVGADYFHVICDDLESGLLVRSDSTDAGSTPDLYLRRTGNATTGEANLGVILFQALNNASPTRQNTTYANIIGQQVSTTDGDEDGRVLHRVVKDGTITTILEVEKTGIDVTGTVTADSFIIKDGSGNKTTLAENASGNITLTLPSATGTLALTDNPTFTGATTSDSFTGQQTHNIQSGNETMSGHVGEKTICVGATGTVTYTFPDVADGDKGDTWTVVNASDQSITCARSSDTQFSKLVAGSNPATATSVTVAKGGVAEFVVTAANVITVFGSGIS